MNFDLVISGGGIKFYYLLGIKKAIEILIKKRKINLYRLAGTSSGSLIISLIACQIPNKKLVKTYLKYTRTSDFKIKILDKFLDEVLPDNAHNICSNKVYISITKLPYHNQIISNFSSKKHLIEIIKISCAFPLFVNNNIFYYYQGNLYLDGSFTNNTPVFQDKIRKQIIIKPFLIKYDKFNLFDMEPDKYIKYIDQGKNAFTDFINGKKIFPIEWYQEKRQYQKSLFKYLKFVINYPFFLIIIIIIILLLKNKILKK